jgi:hypothetical protein
MFEWFDQFVGHLLQSETCEKCQFISSQTNIAMDLQSLGGGDKCCQVQTWTRCRLYLQENLRR